MKRTSTLLLLFLTFLLTACGSKTVRMYTLAPAQVSAGSSPFRDSDVRVEYPKGIEDTMGTRIYYTRSDLTRSYYLYNEWSQPLNRLVMAHLIDALQRSRTFRNVLDYASEAGADYLLETTIYRFGQRITDQGAVAEISIGLRLLRNGDHTLVKSRRFDYRIPCESADAPGFVKAANQAMERLADDMVRWLKR
jgi:cholesterol transport system auxiliary component